MTTPSFLRILEVFDRYGVEFVVVGGVAAVLQGAPVTTFDIDALVRVSHDNAQRLLPALAELDAHYREHGPSHRPTLADLLAGGHMLLATNSGPLDVLGFIGHNQRFESLVPATDEISVGGLVIRVLTLDELIAQKRLTGRDKDQSALRMLEAIRKRRDER